MNAWWTYRRATVLAALCILGGVVWGITGTRDSARADPRFIVNGETVAQSYRVEQAIPDASERVGFGVRLPQNVPERLQLSAISTDVGGAAELDQDGNPHDLSWSRTAYLLYEDDHGQHVSISQSPPERSTKLPAGAQPRHIDVGDSSISVMVSRHRPDRLSVSWDSPEATYSAIYVFRPDSVSHNEAEQVLLDMLGSME